MIPVEKPGYKEAEIGWIPSEWLDCKLGDLVVKVGSGVTPKGGSESYLTSGVPLIRSQNVLWGRLSLSDVAYISADQHQRMANSVLHPLDVLLNITGASIGRCAVLPEDFGEGNVNQHVCIIRPADSLLPGFLSQYLNSQFGQGQISKLQAGGNREGLNFQQIRGFSIGLPPLPEQQKIAAILSAVDDKLDVIARQIEATQTLKQGLMQTLFSRGVGTQDANGRWVSHTEFKESELGKIPIGWDVRSLASLSQSITVGIATSTTEHYVKNGVPLVRNQNIKEDYLDLSDLLMIAPAFDERNKSKRVKAGDILTVRTGYPGVSCVVPEGLGNFQTFTTLITRPKHEVLNAHYASRYFNSPEGKMRMLHQAAGGAQQNINAGNLKKLQVPLPPVIEQEEISKILCAVEDKTRALAMKKTHFLSIKRGLMQKLLTGEWRIKIDAET